MRALLVEDEVSFTKGIELTLQQNSLVCDSVKKGEEALEMVRLYEYDIILLNPILTDQSGYKFLIALRAMGVATPVLIVSSLAIVEEKVKSFKLGADDYLTKPFNREELLARIQALIRRSQGHSNSTIQVGNLTIDLNEQVALLFGKRVPLTSKEYSIIEFMALRKGSPVAKEVFLNHLYNGLEEPELKIIDVFICKIRRKLMQITEEDYIKTVWGKGYMLEGPHTSS